MYSYMRSPRASDFGPRLRTGAATTTFSVFSSLLHGDLNKRSRRSLNPSPYLAGLCGTDNGVCNRSCLSRAGDVNAAGASEHHLRPWKVTLERDTDWRSATPNLRSYFAPIGTIHRSGVVQQCEVVVLEKLCPREDPASSRASRTLGRAGNDCGSSQRPLRPVGGGLKP